MIHWCSMKSHMSRIRRLCLPVFFVSIHVVFCASLQHSLRPSSCGLTLPLSVSSLLSIFLSCWPFLFLFFWRHARSSHCDWIHQKTTLHLIGSAPHRHSFPPHFPSALLWLYSLFFFERHVFRNETGRWPHEGEWHVVREDKKRRKVTIQMDHRSAWAWCKGAHDTKRTQGSHTSISAWRRK